MSRKTKYEHISQEARRQGFLSATQLVTYHQLCLLHRILVTGETEELRALFSTTDHDHGTRYTDRLVTARAKTCAGERRICNIGVKKINGLPSGVRSAATPASFKRALIVALLNV